MAVLTAEDRASRALDIQAHITTDPMLVTIARPARGSSSRGPAEALYTDVPMVIWPSTGDSAPLVLVAVPSVGGARVGAVGFAPAATDIQEGDEVWAPNATYKVQGTDTWQASIAVALNAVRPRPNS